MAKTPEAPAFDPLLPHRLRALAGILKGERAVFKAHRAAVLAWLKIVRAAVLHDTPAVVAAAGDNTMPDAENTQPQTAAAWETFLDEKVLPAIGDIYSGRFTEISKGVDIGPATFRAHYLAVRRPNLLVSVPDLVFEKLRAEITAGTKAGESIPQLRDRVKKVLDDAELPSTKFGAIIKDRSTAVARTETIGAYNAGAVNAAQEVSNATGKQFVKAWLATTVGPAAARTRPTHLAAEGETVPIDGLFDVGGEHLSFPGDSSHGAGPGTTVNCRCTLRILAEGDPGFPITASALRAIIASVRRDRIEAANAAARARLGIREEGAAARDAAARRRLGIREPNDPSIAARNAAAKKRLGIRI